MNLVQWCNQCWTWPCGCLCVCVCGFLSSFVPCKFCPGPQGYSLHRACPTSPPYFHTNAFLSLLFSHFSFVLAISFTWVFFTFRFLSSPSLHSPYLLYGRLYCKVLKYVSKISVCVCVCAGCLCGKTIMISFTEMVVFLFITSLSFFIVKLSY